MPSRLKQLKQQLADAKAKGDTDKIDIIQQELFTLSKPRPKKISDEVVGDPFLEKQKNTNYFIPRGSGKEFISEMPVIDRSSTPGFTEPQEIKKGGMTKGQKKVGKVMREFKAGKLHSGKKGPVVKNPKQAIAIALSEAGMSKPKQMSVGGDVQVGKGQDYIKDLI
jgi:hypothetical protein